MFKRILDVFRPQNTDPDPEALKGALLSQFGITAEEFAELAELRGHPGWKVYAKTLDALITFNGEALLTTRTNEDVHYLRGKVTGLREAPNHVDVIIAKERELAERPRAAATGSDDARIIATYGTPAYRK